MKEGKIDLNIKNTNFTYPVLVDLITGEVLIIEEFENRGEDVYFSNIPLMDYLLCLVERNGVEIINLFILTNSFPRNFNHTNPHNLD
ncbi:MAG: hypothetical protein KAS71_10435 [Bacteroidales bacterium]|nr:hypothetical protein [Bacteroidales bacterium]